MTNEYEYDDHGIKCLNYGGDYSPVEPHCLECGDKPDDCECDKFVPATYWDEEGERWIEPRKRITCRPPVGPPKENEPEYETNTFLWSTVEELLEEYKPTKKERFRRWKCGDYIELEYRPTKGRNSSWYYWAIRPCDNFSWVVVAYRNGSPMEMEWCEQLPEEQDDGFEDCYSCGYTHHSEDKCPTGKQCEKYQFWATPEEAKKRVAFYEKEVEALDKIKGLFADEE